MNRLSENITNNCEGLGIIHYAYNIPTISFEQQRKESLNKIFSYYRNFFHSNM